MTSLKFCSSVVIILFFFSRSCSSSSVFDPEQIQITLPGAPNALQISWLTPSPDNTTQSVVLFGYSPNNYTLKAKGKSHSYNWNGYSSGAIHVVILEGLERGTKYYYRCGDETRGLSPEFFFHTEPEMIPSPSDPLRIAVLADHGTSRNSEMVLNALIKEHANNPFHFLILAGDLSYANRNESIWDYWGRMITPSTAYLPWMFAPGNHELYDNLASYQTRFAMPKNGYDGNMYYSFNYRNAHIIALNAEDYDMSLTTRQFKWLRKDLASVDRKETPWIIAFWHSPWYCSNKVHQEDGFAMREEMEDLLFQYKVDFCVTGHVHAYERILPIYKKVLNEDGPVYIVNGHGGNAEGLYPNWNPQPNWSAFRQALYYGYSVISISNDSSLNWKMIKADDLSIGDQYTLTRDRSTFKSFVLN